MPYMLILNTVYIKFSEKIQFLQLRAKSPLVLSITALLEDIPSRIAPGGTIGMIIVSIKARNSECRRSII